MSFLSVIIPNYNHAPYLRQRIESVLNQTYTNFEVIILDDCSTDNSREVIERYRAHAKVSQIVYNDTNSGSTFKQWSKGIHLARGEWIWIAESDDWCEPDFLEELLTGIKRNKKTVMAWCGTHVVSSSGEITSRLVEFSSSQCMSGIEYLKHFLIRRNTIVNSSMLIFRKNAFFQSDVRFDSLRFSGDWLLYIHLILKGDVYISPKLLNYFRKHDGDVTGKAILFGLAYSEYPIILRSLFDLGIIDKGGFQGLLMERALMFKSDKRVQSDYRAVVWNQLWIHMSSFNKVRFVFFSYPKSRIMESVKDFLAR